MSYKNIKTEHKNKTFTITVNRPKQLNALNRDTIEELGTAIKDGERNKEVNAIIITGSGEKAFVAGADIKEFAEFSVTQGKELSREGHEKLFNVIENLKKPVIAAINGYCLGGGLELAMACHIRIASNHVLMGLPEVSLGVIPGYGGTQRLTQLVGKGKAFEMILTAELIHAQNAKDWGLVNHIANPNELIQMANDIAEKIANNSPMAISLAIKAINAAQTDGINGYQVEIEKFGETFGTEDFKIGTHAFLHKEKAQFKGY